MALVWRQRRSRLRFRTKLVEALAAAARAEGIPLSRLVASAAENELRRRVGRQLMADWQAEHGASSVEELAAARAEMAAADAEAFMDT
jgi:post-segregation antitoxin (ccd killing protein)